MVGYRRQKFFLLTAAVAAAVLIFLYFYSLRKTSDAFKPVTLIFTSTSTHNVKPSDAGSAIHKDVQPDYQRYDNSVQFDHVSTSIEMF